MAEFHRRRGMTPRDFLRKSHTAYKFARTAPKGWPSFVWNTAMAQLGRAGPLLPPVYLAIEPTNACNAKCPVCETGKGQMERRKGLLDIAHFNRLIDEVAPTTNSVMLYFMGETFLNKNAYDMIRHARSKNIYVETCTNGDFVDPKGIIYSDINKIAFQIGGMTDATHERYRVASQLGKVRLNLEALVEERRRNPGSNVQIDVGFIVMRHNEHEVPEFLRWAKEIGADSANIIDPCVRNMLEGHVYLPKDRRYWFYDEAAFEQGVLKPKKVPENECAWIWNSMQITWNGDAVPCCRDPNGRHVFGNVFEDGVRRVFNGKKALDFRRRILTDQGGIDICRLCSSYGLPQMTKTRPLSFEARRSTFNKDELVLPQA
jgi:MoaA/NifB/PqqE/SkfB family radical SAM enzyme